MAGIKSTLVPPGKPDEAYVVPYLEGHVVDISSSASVIRVMVTAKETNNTFALVTAGGSEGAPIIFHYHNEAHDIFLCTQGQMNVWANDQGRTLNPGDMASVPPGVIHRYQILGTHTEFWGPIVPADWIEMFYAMGDIAPEDSVLYQSPDTRDPMKTLFPRLKDLPDSGPKYAAAGLLFKPLVGLKQTHNRFVVSRIEGTNRIPSKLPKLRYPSHQAITVVEGAFRVDVGEYAQEVQTGQTIFIPARNAATLAATTRYASLYVTCDGVGFPAALGAIGKEYSSPVISVGFDSDPDVSGYEEAFKRLGLQ
ncbi:RmlC-like cupin domain-containing protein [Fusarium sp. MPI-SDFR-AT-0072]|nr:RmlC-like cupin domain-containing protein [Fusarium sp. MPI-SDFR-AT-0072]